MADGRAFLLTGTDTGIGKTTVTCAVAAALSRRGIRVGVGKPAETGCEVDANGALIPADAGRLRYFSGCREPLDTICPIRCREPLAPAVALRREARTIDAQDLRATMLGIAARHDVTLIEGAGGLLVPVIGSVTFAELAREWQLPVVVVVGNRLGAINHAQLTVRYAEQAGLTIGGYVINTLGPDGDVAAQTNVDCLRELLGAPIGVLPWLGPVACTPDDRTRLARVAEESLALARLIAPR